MGIKRCPNCGSEKLLAKKIVGVQVESLMNGEFEIKAEGSKIQLTIVGCAKCKSDFDESALVELVKCKKCGKLTQPNDLDANGECDICRALQENPELANLSKEDILRMYLKLRETNISASPVSNVTPVPTTPITNVAEEKMKAAQNAIANAGNNTTTELVKEIQEEDENNPLMNQMNPPVESTEESTEEEKPKKRRGPRKKSETTTENVDESINTIADFQEAPFPEQDDTLAEVFSEVQENVPLPEMIPETPQQQSFQMFDDSEQSF